MNKYFKKFTKCRSSLNANLQNLYKKKLLYFLQNCYISYKIVIFYTKLLYFIQNCYILYKIVIFYTKFI